MTETRPSMATPAEICVVENVVFSPLDDEPTDHPSSYTRAVRSDEMPYTQDFKATPEWRPLPLGWLQGCPVSFVKLENKRKRRQTLPDPEELAAEAEMVIELGYAHADEEGALIRGVVAFALVRPGEDMRIEFKDPSLVRVRCPVGECKGRLTIYPA